MPINIDIKVEGLNKLREAIHKRPDIVRSWLNKAIAASMFEIEKKGTDRNFQFKTPRGLRTGYLQRSFKQGIQLGNLTGSIGPTVKYAQYVHNGTRFLLPNKFMPRIADDAQPNIQKHFNEAVEEIAKEMVQ